MIYIITHKKFSEYFNDRLHYKILHVGTNKNTDDSYINDSTGENISSKNSNFCELTGLYWIWKNGLEAEHDITGLLHYRRYFTTWFYDLAYTYFGVKPKVLKYKKITSVLQHKDIILPKPEKIYRTVRQSYIDVHNDEDLILTKQTIEEVCPQYATSFDRVMNSHSYYFGNMMLCSKKLMDEYSEWLFSILFVLEKKIDINKYSDDYQKRVFGFLSERLLQVWVFHNQLSVAEFPVFNVDSRRINAFEKNLSRLKHGLRKLGIGNGKK